MGEFQMVTEFSRGCLSEALYVLGLFPVGFSLFVPHADHGHILQYKLGIQWFESYMVRICEYSDTSFAGGRGGGLVSQVQDVYSCVTASGIILYSWNKKKSTGYVYDITHHINCRRNQQDERVKIEQLSKKSSTI